MIQVSSELPVIERSSLKIASFIDLAASQKTSADYTVIATCGIDDLENIYILNIRRGRWPWPDTQEILIAEILEHGIRMAGVESNGFQLAAFQDLARRPELADVAIYPVDVDRDLVSRALLLSARGAAGKLFYRRGAPWIEDVISEFVELPSGRHDDIVSAVSGCVNLLNRYRADEPVIAPISVTGRSRWKH